MYVKRSSRYIQDAPQGVFTNWGTPWSPTREGTITDLWLLIVLALEVIAWLLALEPFNSRYGSILFPITVRSLTEILPQAAELEVVDIAPRKAGGYIAKLRTTKPATVVDGFVVQGSQLTLYIGRLAEKPDVKVVTIDPEKWVYEVHNFTTKDGTVVPLKWIRPV